MRRDILQNHRDVVLAVMPQVRLPDSNQGWQHVQGFPVTRDPAEPWRQGAGHHAASNIVRQPGQGKLGPVCQRHGLCNVIER